MDIGQSKITPISTNNANGVRTQVPKTKAALKLFYPAQCNANVINGDQQTIMPETVFSDGQTHNVILSKFVRDNIIAIGETLQSHAFPMDPNENQKFNTTFVWKKFCDWAIELESGARKETKNVNEYYEYIHQNVQRALSQITAKNVTVKCNAKPANVKQSQANAESTMDRIFFSLIEIGAEAAGPAEDPATLNNDLPVGILLKLKIEPVRAKKIKLFANGSPSAPLNGTAKGHNRNKRTSTAANIKATPRIAKLSKLNDSEPCAIQTNNNGREKNIILPTVVQQQSQNDKVDTTANLSQSKVALDFTKMVDQQERSNGTILFLNL